jgi:hypothetical protein
MGGQILAQKFFDKTLGLFKCMRKQWIYEVRLSTSYVAFYFGIKQKSTLTSDIWLATYVAFY